MDNKKRIYSKDPFAQQPLLHICSHALVGPFAHEHHSLLPLVPPCPEGGGCYLRIQIT